MDDYAKKFFVCSDRERACFEAGIKLSTIYHQFTGIPFNKKIRQSIIKAMEDSISVQPFVEKVSIDIKEDFVSDKSYLKEKKKNYDYASLDGKMMHAVVLINYMGNRAEGIMEYVEEMDYPLMYVRVIDG